MTNRIGKKDRKTGEVDIYTEILLDTPGDYQISITADKEEIDFGFGALNLFEHLFAQIYHHGRLGGKVKGHGDIPHHILEDVGICWGQAIKEALGDRKGIERFQSLTVPFEGSLATVAVDLSGRGYATLDFQDMDNKTLAGMAQHLFEGIALNAGLNIYGKVETMGTLRNDHHKLEAFCKAFGRSLHRATRISGPDAIPSTKGTLE
ncbi:MAG: imidazoleglycerol-phosphate dehydratase [Candidatus Nealsonbacteria bacterium CG02_land_8_20_14_3_00_37_10]|uniref:Imidazoleglycerol-phosphate dehydratase n=2 Tax=Candidatus Nealsoniibacteriota TaxID=1817911 RepID=A0A2G9YZG2_9BACT|nr:MAG: imidazoleglycerol-phosphate dehydratase [Candidatus Nealsonbacteria bacterium CG23_combo_of_CG06-09_8_20_14_all_37_18]PIV45362.1 MAG: imidazoleglycerol-phosphate dehydratase [Candidatus Nealsonbacteria bacterium CG02_land_8_20_14_3_00_37_10]